MTAEEVLGLTFFELVMYLNAIPQLIALDEGVRVPYTNVAFAGVPKGKRPPKIPSFWLEESDVEDWREASRKKGLKFPG